MENIKKLLFTHGIDIDGYGCAILAKLAWKENVDIVYADNFDLDKKFIKLALNIDLDADDLAKNPKKYAKLLDDSKTLKQYNQIFVTDHCFSMELCTALNQTNLKNKILVFDHHSSRIGQQDKFSWINIISERNNKKECGTSLFYKYLKQKHLIKENNEKIKEWVNLTRLYDTWEWTKTGETKADRLNTFALAIGRENYVQVLENNLIDIYANWFGKEENKIVDKYIQYFNKEVNKYVNQIKVIDFAGTKAGYVEILDIFKNDIATAVRKSDLSSKVDFMLMPVQDRESVSLRNVNPEFDVSTVAAQFGGGGHKGAASFPKQNLPKIEKTKDI